MEDIREDIEEGKQSVIFQHVASNKDIDEKVFDVLCEKVREMDNNEGCMMKEPDEWNVVLDCMTMNTEFTHKTYQKVIEYFRNEEV